MVQYSVIKIFLSTHEFSNQKFEAFLMCCYSVISLWIRMLNNSRNFSNQSAKTNGSFVPFKIRVTFMSSFSFFIQNMVSQVCVFLACRPHGQKSCAKKGLGRRCAGGEWAPFSLCAAHVRKGDWGEKMDGIQGKEGLCAPLLD